MTNKERAFMLAEKAHANQTYDIYPYMYHIRMVVKILDDLGYDESIIIAGILHDAVEDDSLSYNKILKAFGKEIAEIVYAVTDELGRNRDEKKKKTYPKIKANWKAVIVKTADRIANVKHSKLYTPSKYKMYRDEQKSFEKGIYISNTDVQKIWNLLTHTLKTYTLKDG